METAEPTRSQRLLQRHVSLGSLFWEFLRIGATGFGGGLQARFYHIAVTEHGWLNDEEFAEVTTTASLAPGGNSGNVGIEVARRLRGWPGMVVASLALVVPGALLMILAGDFYATHRRLPMVRGAEEGLESAAVALVLYSATKLNLRTWQPGDYLVAAAAALGLAWLRWPLVVVLPALTAVSWWQRRRMGR